MDWVCRRGIAGGVEESIKGKMCLCRIESHNTGRYYGFVPLSGNEYF